MTAAPDDDPLLRETASGLVRGVRQRGVLAWRGIPYAAAPTGARRFRAPAPAAPWQGVRDAAAFGPAAPQDRGQFVGVDRPSPTRRHRVVRTTAVVHPEFSEVPPERLVNAFTHCTSAPTEHGTGTQAAWNSPKC